MNKWFQQRLHSIEGKTLLSVAVIILLFSSMIFGLIEFASHKITQIEKGLFEEQAQQVIENIYLVTLTEDMQRLAQELELEVQKNRQISSIKLLLDGRSYLAQSGKVDDFIFHKNLDDLSFVITGINFLKVPLEAIQYLSVAVGIFSLFVLWLFHKALRRFIRQPVTAIANTLDFYASDAFKANPRVQTLTPSGTELDVLIEKADKIYQSKLAAIAHEIALRQTVEKAVETKNIFIASMVHDFRTPLIIMQGLLKEQQAQLSPALLTPLFNQLDEMELMVSNALDLSRIESGQPVVLRPKETKLFELVNSVVDSFQAEANAKGLYIYVRLNGCAQSYLVIDDAKYKQVLRNLVSNAVKYTEQGHIEVSIECETNQLRTQVADTGRGVSPEQAQAIFMPFHRIANDQVQGTGVGLSFCKLMLNSIGFDLVLNSPQQGAEFKYVFPVVEWRSYPKHRLEGNQFAGGRQVVIISADTAVADYLAASFNNQGFQVCQNLADLQRNDLLVLHELLAVSVYGTEFNPLFPMQSAVLSQTLQLARKLEVKVVLFNNAKKPSPNVLKMFGHNQAYILSEFHQLVQHLGRFSRPVDIQADKVLSRYLSDDLIQKAILVADDTPAYQSLVVQQLKGLGFKRVYTANNGQEALQICQEHGIEIVFMDHMMPIMSGVEAAQAIKRHSPKTLIIGFSAVLPTELSGEKNLNPMDKVYLKDFKNFEAVFRFVKEYFQKVN